MYIIHNPANRLYYKGDSKWTKRKTNAFRYYYRSSAEFMAEDYFENEQLEIIDLEEL